MTDEREKLAAELRDYEGYAERSGCGLADAPCRLFSEAAAYIEAHPASALVEYDEGALRGILRRHAPTMQMRLGGKMRDLRDDAACISPGQALSALSELAIRLSQVTAQRDELARALTKIACLNPDVDSSEGCEWGEADCFHKAQDISRAALSRINGEQK